MKPASWIIIILALLSHTATAQLWRYLHYDPKAEKAFDAALDKEASSITTKTDIVYGEKIPYKIRTYGIRSFDGSRSKIVLTERSARRIISIKGPNSNIQLTDII